MAVTLTDAPATAPGLRLRGPVGLCFLAFVLLGCQDSAFSVLLPSLITQYHTDKAGISLMLLAASAGYLCAAFSSGPLVERLGRRVFLVGGTACFALGALALALIPATLLFLAALFVYAFGVGILDAGLNAYFASLPNSTTALNYLHAIYGGGALLGPVVASAILAGGLTWNYTYLLWLVLAVGLLVGFARVFDDTRSARPARGGSVLAGALRLPLVWVAAAFLFLNIGAEVGMSSWSYSFLTLERHGPALLSAWSVSGYWLGLMLARLLMGRVVARLGGRRAILLFVAGAAAGALLMWIAPNGLVAAAGLGLIGFSLGPLYPTGIAYLAEVVPAPLLSSAVGFVSSISGLGGSFFPWLVGTVAQAVGLWILLPYSLGLTVGMALLWLLLARPRG